jgi:hypothetical protein
MFGEIEKWILIAIGGSIGFVILDIVGWQTLYTIAPDFVEKYHLFFILKDVKRHFGFLLDKGYKISKAEYSFQHFGNWVVMFESQKCKIILIQDRLELLLSFAPRKTEVKEGFSLGTMVYFLTEEHYFIPPFEGNLSWGKRKQFEQSANLLRKFHDQIVPYLDDNEIWESNYWKHKNQLLATQQIYNKAMTAYYRKKHLNK